jgi:putative membrane-bound dehydrogenase-like protein
MILLALGAAISSGAQDSRDYRRELPRLPAVAAKEAVETMKVGPGFRMEQVAAEPLVHDPVAMAFDENGGLYVVEMRGYSEQRDELRGAIRLLEDADADGKFDRSTVLVDRLPWPTAVACWKGGVFVAAPPDIWYFKDTDGDGAADVRKKILTGFSHYNVQAMVNSFRWGLDNRIHGAASSGGGEVKPVGAAEGKALKIRLRDFAFDPRTMEFAATTEGGQHGMGFDEWGRKFSCSNSDHLKQVVYEERYLTRNPWYSARDSRISIAAEGTQPEVFRISPVEPWRILRTKLRLDGTLMQFRLEGGGRAAGYFTAATGITIYRGDAWPREFKGLAVIGDVGGNLIHRNRLEANGIEFVGRRIDERSEFVASRDTWFRPVQFANGPDGNLYVADMYREIIEHPWSFGDEIKPHLHLTSGRDRGRIYRIVHQAGKVRERSVRLGDKSDAELAGLLGHPNAWHRETAARLLYERRDKSSADAIRRTVRASANPLGRMHGLYGLAGLEALRPADLIVALGDRHPQVRGHAIRMAEQFVGEDLRLRRKLEALATDPDLGVRFQLAFTLGEIADDSRLAALVKIARRDSADKWVRLAIMTSLRNGADRVYTKLLADREYRKSDGARAMLGELARMIARKNEAAEIDTLLAGLGGLDDDEQALTLAVVLGLRKGVSTRSATYRRLTTDPNPPPGVVRFRAVLEQALGFAEDSSRSLAERQDAVSLIGLLPFARVRDGLTSLLGGGERDDLQKSVLGVLGLYRDEAVTGLVVGLVPRLGPGVRTAAMDALFVRRERYPWILDAVESGDLNPGDLNAIQIQRMCLNKDAAQAARAVRLLSPGRKNERSKVIQDYRSSLRMSGDIDRGRALYRTACATCHRAEEFGNVVGPNPATFRNRGDEWIMVNILDPNREVNPEFANYSVTTRDDREVAGLITTESTTGITVTRADGVAETILRKDIAEMSASRLSLMPEGLEQSIDQQGMADILAYLNSLK